MAKNNIESYYFSGQGVVLMGELDEHGNAHSLRPIGNVSALTLAIETSRNEHRESQTGSRGVDKVITTEVACNVNMTLEHLIQDNLAIGLYGDTATVAAATNKTLAVAKVVLGTVTALDGLNVSDVVVDDGKPTPAITYAEGKHYRVNAEAGSIYWMTTAEQTAAQGGGGSATMLDENASIHVQYATGEYKELSGLTSSVAPVRFLRYEGLNTVENNDPVVVEIFKFETAPLAEYALINEEISNIQLEGNALADVARVTGSKYFRQLSLK